MEENSKKDLSDPEVSFMDEEEEVETVKENTAKTEKEKPLTKEEEEIVDKAIGEAEENKEKEDVKLSVVDMLVKFKNFIRSDDFDKKVSRVSKTYGIKKAVVKNKFIRGFLGTIADVLNLTVAIAGDIIVSAVKFVNNIIRNIVNFGAGILHKLINLLTLNCGTIIL